MFVIKRNGKVVPFNRNNIKLSITNAFKSASPNSDNGLNIIDVTDRVVAMLKNRETVASKDIQSMVENTFMDRRHYDAAKLYILYRERKVTTIYTVFHRIRSHRIEQLIESDNVHIYDTHEIQFQSFSKDKAIDYCENHVKRLNNDFWKSISKGVMITPVEKDNINGLLAPDENDMVMTIMF